MEYLAHDQVPPRILEYAKEVLKAVEWKWGPAHLEIFDVPGRGPVLGEIGGRVGGGLREMNLLTTGQKIDSWIAEALLRPQEFQAKAALPYPTQQHAFIVGLNSPADGLSLDTEVEDKLRSLPGFQDYLPAFSTGEPLPKTTDLFTTPARLWFVHPDKREIEGSLTAFRQMAAAGDFFKSDCAVWAKQFGELSD